MTRKPIFVDLGGSTARIDPPINKATYSKLTICAESTYDPELGNITARGVMVEMWLDAEHAEAMAEALKQGCKP